MTNPFVEFLINRHLVPASVARQLTENKRYVREPIGMIAVSHGLLKPNQIDDILDRQRGSKARFGDIAVELGFLTREQVETLVKIQEFRTTADIAEALALAGVTSCEDVTQYLGAFLLHDRELSVEFAGSCES